MSRTWLLVMGSLVAIVCAGLVLPCSSVSSSPSGVTAVSDSEATKIMGGGEGSKYGSWKSCKVTFGMPGCSNSVGGYAATGPGSEGQESPSDCGCGTVAASIKDVE